MVCIALKLFKNTQENELFNKRIEYSYCETK